MKNKHEHRHIVHIITGLSDGGAEAVLYRLCTADTLHRHSVVSLMDEGKYGRLLRDAGVTVHALNMSQGKLRLKPLLRLWRLLRSMRPDIVQTWMYHADLIAGVMARAAGVRNVFWNIRQADLAPGASKRSTVLVAKISALLSARIPVRIISCAEEATKSHVKLGYNREKFKVIPNGYHLKQFRPDTHVREGLRAQWRVAPETPLLGMVARFHPQKDHNNLITALSLLKDRGVSFRCVLVGRALNGDNQGLVEQIGRSNLDDEILLLGQRNDIPDVMNALDIHVLSSLTEGFPNVIAEAMACGTPCVSTDVGDAALIVGDTGWVVPARKPEALADAIQKAIESREGEVAWRKRQHAARRRIEENFSIEVMVNSYHEAWSEASPNRR